MKKRCLTLLLLLGLLSGCGRSAAGEITVISREEGSGTRSAFAELLGIAEEGGDRTTERAEITNSNAVVLQSVAGDPNAIGYVSLGALSDRVRTVTVDGAEPTAAQIQSGRYGMTRPFLVCFREERLTDLGRDFLSFAQSAEGQEIAEAEGYLTVHASAPPYRGTGGSGTLSISGSTAAAPLMEVMAEAYRERWPRVTIDIQQTGSGAGITAVLDGSCEIGLSSRPLKAEELAQGLTERQLALDGIAVIVSRDNGVTELSSDQLRRIFTGEITDWSQIGHDFKGGNGP